MSEKWERFCAENPAWDQKVEWVRAWSNRLYRQAVREWERTRTGPYPKKQLQTPEHVVRVAALFMEPTLLPADHDPAPLFAWAQRALKRQTVLDCLADMGVDKERRVTCEVCGLRDMDRLRWRPSDGYACRSCRAGRPSHEASKPAWHSVTAGGFVWAVWAPTGPRAVGLLAAAMPGSCPAHNGLVRREKCPTEGAETKSRAWPLRLAR